MKNLFNIAISFAVAAMALVACTKDLEQVVDEEPIAVGSHITFYAEPDDPATRVTLTPTTSEEKAFKGDWEDTDKIELHAVGPNSFDETGDATWNLTDGCFEADFETTAPTTPGAWTYTAKYPYTENGNIPFGTDRVQNGNAYNSAYDVMYGTRSYDNALLGKDNNGNPFILPMQRLTCIAYFHITGGPNEPVVSATLEATGIAAENITIAADGSAVTRVNNSSLDAITITFEDGTAPTAEDLQLWFNVMPGEYPGLTLTIFTANHTTVLHNNKTLTYTAGKLNRAKLSGLNWAENVFFEERFSEANGTSGWNGSAASATFVSDNDGWDATAPFSSYKAARFGTNSKDGNATTPSITIPPLFWDKTLHFSFKAGAWTGRSTTLGLSVDGATLSESSVTLLDSEWQLFDLTITNISKSQITISFTKSDQWFLDDVLVYYGTRPIASQLVVTPIEDRTVGYLAGSLEYSVSYTIDEVESSDWDVTTSSEGFSVAKKNDNTGFTVSYTQNNGTTRTGVITITAGNNTETVSVIQNEKLWYDILTAGKIGVSTYSDWSNIIDNTGVKYAGNSTTSNKGAIQLRSTEYSGIVSTTTVGVIRRIVVDWGEDMAQNRVLDIYGSNDAYSNASDLYSPETQGTLLGSLTWSSSSEHDTELIIDEDYKYVGVRSHSGALYLADIEFHHAEYDPNRPKFSARIIGDDHVPATTTSVSVGVTGNVAWTATATNGASVNPASGNGEGTITVTLPENTNVNQTASYVVTVATTADVSTQSFDLTFTQEQAINPDDTPKTYTITWNSKNNSASVSSYTASWSVTSDGITCNMQNWNNNNNDWNFVKAGRKNNASVATIITNSAIPEAIKTVTLTIDAITASKINSIKLFTSSSSSFGTTEVGTFTIATGDQSITIPTPTKQQYYKIEVDCASGSSNGLITVSKLVFSTN